MEGADWQSHLEFMSQKKPLYRLPLRFGYEVPHGGEAKTHLKQTIDLEINHRHQPEKNSSPCPLHLERGKRTSRLIVTIGVRSKKHG